ncbi:MAG: NAD(P)/FAD-dependent oxidoreductase [Beutenbergiaceae bacterium]
MPRVVVVGASLAGFNAAGEIRRGDPDLELTIVGAEPHRPYDRPPLSKDYLQGTTESGALALRGAAEPDSLGATWRLGVSATGLRLTDDGAHVQLDDGTELAADGVVIATGSRARTLPGPQPAGVVTVRTLDDARWLRDRLAAGPGALLVIGLGFIGAEVAATARQAGWEVAVVEAAATPLSRVLDPRTGPVIADLHRAHGVDVRLGTTVERLDGGPDGVEAAVLNDGSRIRCSVVVVGIGAQPVTDWLDDSGLSIGNGVIADETTRAAPRVVVAGDVASWPNPWCGGRRIRIEQWDNAIAMGAHAGRRLLAELAGQPGASFAPVPWFWSDQYQRKFQLAGLTSERTEVLHGSLTEPQFVVLYLDADDNPIGVLCSNRPRQAIQGRMALAEHADKAAIIARLRGV